MKRYVRKSNSELEIIHIVMYLRPIIYANSEAILGTVTNNGHKYYTDVNPERIINGPLSEYGEELESPVKEEYEEYINDCLWLIKELGFTIISESRSETSKKSEYVLMFGIDDTPCGTIVYDLRLSDHPFDAQFPEELKDLALQYLKINKILDGSASEAGIDFQVEKVTVGSVKNDSWQRAFNRLYKKLMSMKNKIQVRLRTRSSK